MVKSSCVSVTMVKIGCVSYYGEDRLCELIW